jgi:hypothetical protein
MRLDSPFWKTYLVHGSSGHYKIGRSQRPEKRLYSLATTRSGERLTLLFVINDDVEADLHRQFAHLCVGGEWFREDPSIVAAFLNRKAVRMQGSFRVRKRSGWINDARAAVLADNAADAQAAAIVRAEQRWIALRERT